MRTALVFGLIAIVCCVSAETTFADSGLPCSNPTPATQAQVDASNNGLKLGELTCPKDLSSANITNDAGAAKAYLLSIAKNLRNSQAPPNNKEHIDPLNNAFAICAANFLKAYTAAYGPIYVVSAFRCGPYSPSNITCDRSENARAGGAGASNHQFGLAMDIYPANGNYNQAQAFATANPKYGVWFRLGMSDKPHMEPRNLKAPACDGVQGTPTNIPTVASGNSTQTPLGSIGSSLSSLGTILQQTQQPTIVSTPVAQTTQQGLTSAFQTPTYTYITAGTTQTDSTQTTTTTQTTPQSSSLLTTNTTSSGGSVTPSSVTISPPNTGSSEPGGSTGTSASASGTGSQSSASSALDILSQLASDDTNNAATAPTTATGSRLALNDALFGHRTPSSDDPNAPSTATEDTAGSSSVLLPLRQPTTFTSADMANTQPSATVVTNTGGVNTPASSTFMSTTLNSIKQMLLTILSILQPFGNRTTAQEATASE